MAMDEFLGAYDGAVFGDGQAGLAKSATKDPGSRVPPPGEIWTLLSRTTFGPTQQEFAGASAAGYEAWVEYQLTPEAIDASQIEALIATSLPTVGQTTGQILAAVAAGGNQGLAATELTAATMLRQIYSPRQLYEVMVEFWTNHFNVFILDGNARYFKTVDDREVIRRHAMGKFGDLLRASAKSPAMLFYLDNFLNVATGPQENYARELLELHTMGVDGGYTEDDVKAVARAFTGWTFTPYRPQNGFNDVVFTFNRAVHDLGAKRVLGVDLPAGRGIEDGEQVLDILINHPSTARFIATKLVRRFVSDAPPASLVDRVAATYRDTGGDIKAMLRTLLLSSEFRTSGDRKFKRPVEYVVSSLRVLGTTLTGNWTRAVTDAITALGQSYFQWAAPNGYPDVGGYWISSAAMLSRWNHALALGNGTLAGIAVDINALLGSPLPRTPADLVDRLSQRVLRRALSADDRNRLVAFAAAGAPIEASMPPALRTQRAREVLGLLLASNYFMYR
jgi:uncharacterized protein (DUF1800 family)